MTSTVIRIVHFDFKMTLTRHVKWNFIHECERWIALLNISTICMIKDTGFYGVFCSCKTLECSGWLPRRCYAVAKAFSPFFIYLWAAWDSICIFFPQINNSVCSLLVELLSLHCWLVLMWSVPTTSDSRWSKQTLPDHQEKPLFEMFIYTLEEENSLLGDIMHCLCKKIWEHGALKISQDSYEVINNESLGSVGVWKLLLYQSGFDPGLVEQVTTYRWKRMMEDPWGVIGSKSLNKVKNAVFNLLLMFPIDFWRCIPKLNVFSWHFLLLQQRLHKHFYLDQHFNTSECNGNLKYSYYTFQMWDESARDVWAFDGQLCFVRKVWCCMYLAVHGHYTDDVSQNDQYLPHTQLRESSLVDCLPIPATR